MSFEEFQNLARVYVIGGIDEEEMTVFEAARHEFGEKADAYVDECRRLESVFALSLQPHRPKNGAKQRLMDLIRSGKRGMEERSLGTVQMGKDRPFHGASESDI